MTNHTIGQNYNNKSVSIPRQNNNIRRTSNTGTTFKECKLY